MQDRCYYTYIVASRTHVIYIGMTGNIEHRMAQHRNHAFDGFTAKYRCDSITVADTGVVSAPLDASSTFDVWSVFRSIKASSVMDFAKQIAKVLPSKYQSLIAERSRRTGKPFQYFMPGDIAVLGFEEGKPAYVRVIFLTEGATIKAVIKDDGAQFARDLKRNPGIQSIIPLGMFNVIPIGSGPNCSELDIAEEIRCELGAYIEADPIHINKPIAIRELTATGSEWTEHSKPCDQQ